MPFDQNMLQMMSLMGGNIGQMIPDQMMIQKAQGTPPPINLGRYAQGYEIRKAIRGGIVGGRTGGFGGGRMGSPHGGAGDEAMPPIGGGMDPSSMVDPSTANSALQPYGLQLPTHTNPFLFFNDRHQDGTPTWAGNHPRAAKAVEGAMIGLTTEGGQTIGQSISNVAKTALGIPGLYRQNQAAQMQAPFDQARQIGALQDEDAKRQLALSQAFHNFATGQAALEKTPPQKATIPMEVGGSMFGYNPTDNSMSPTTGAPPPGTAVTRVGTPGKPGDANKLPAYVKSLNERAAFFDYKSNGGEFDDNGQPKDTSKWNRLVTQYTGRNAAAAGAGSTGGRKTTEMNLGGLNDTQKATLQAKKEAVENAKSSAKEKLTPSQFVNEKDPLAAMNAERQRRRGAWDSAEKDYQDTVQGMSGGTRNSNDQGGGGSKPGVVVHPDGRVEVKP